MKNEILLTVKKALGIPEEDCYFDIDLINNINSVFYILNQMGVGPEKVFYMDPGVSYRWENFDPNIKDFSVIKSYTIFKTMQFFDPPASSSVSSSLEQKLKELEWRICCANLK